jgi:hypothetical protein
VFVSILCQKDWFSDKILQLKSRPNKILPGKKQTRLKYSLNILKSCLKYNWKKEVMEKLVKLVYLLNDMNHNLWNCYKIQVYKYNKMCISKTTI